MSHDAEARRIESLVRALSAAVKSLRLYPPSSPMPRQSAEAVRAMLEEHFATGASILSLKVVREGFMWQGTPVAAGALSTDFVGDLQGHGIAELDALPGSTIDEILAFLSVIGTDAEQARGQGGVSTMLAAAGVETLRVVDVHLTVAEQIGPADDQDVDEFLRQLINDPEKLAAWFAGASSGDPRAFEEGLLELVRVAGTGGHERLLEALSGAFRAQETGGKDALLGLAMESGPARDLTGGVFRFLSSGDIAGAVLEGTFGKNMLSLSAALTKLPLEAVSAQVRAEVQAMLPGAGHSAKEASFLEHMMEARRQDGAPALVDSDRTYREMVSATALPADVITKARSAVSHSVGAVTAASVKTISALLEQQKDLELFCGSAAALGQMVPKLVEQGELELAERVVGDLARRMTVGSGPWPTLAERLQAIIAQATGPQTMSALMKHVATDAGTAELAKRIIRHGGEPAIKALVAEAVSHKAEGITAAEQLIGRRIVDILADLAPQVQWYQVRPITARLAAEGNQRSLSAVEALTRRADEQSRREVAAGLADSRSPAALRLLAAMLKDPSSEVAVIASRAIARCGQPGAAAMLAARLGELDIDGQDFVVGREIIVALAAAPEPAADETLRKLAGRKALIKRGHFVEVQEVVARAIEHRAKGGVRV